MADRSTRPKQSARRDDAISELSETNVSVDLGSLDLGDDTQRNDLLDDDTTIKSDILQEFGDPGTGRSEKDSEGLHSGDQPSRKQLEHEVQLLKIEVSQKNLLLENVRAQCNAHMDDLREKLADATREKAALHARVENELLALREDANRRHDQRGDEILELKRRQSQLESLNSQLLEKLEQSKAFLQGQVSYFNAANQSIDLTQSFHLLCSTMEYLTWMRTRTTSCVLVTKRRCRCANSWP